MKFVKLVVAGLLAADSSAMKIESYQSLVSKAMNMVGADSQAYQHLALAAAAPDTAASLAGAIEKHS